MSSTLRQTASLGEFGSVVDEALRRIEAGEFIRRIRDRDAALWKADDPHRKIIGNALGWLQVARDMEPHAGDLEKFTSEVREAGFTHAMLLGMGGSSLCPEVLRRTFGSRPGFPSLLVLDTTDPDAISAFEESVDLARTLFIVSSKSGSTIEPLSFYRYFYDRVQSRKGERAGDNFVAITDPGTLMERMAHEANFRRVFLNPADIGGRYSALSYFGLVPASLIGLDIGELLRRAVNAADRCLSSAPVHDNPGATLGAVMGALAMRGRDKLTIVANPPIDSIGLWIEQLVAESTGKEGKGIIPVANEPLGPPAVYGNDRLFVSVQVGDAGREVEAQLQALEKAGHPVVRRHLNDPLDIGAEFYVWEIATAVAGALLGIDAFDQPNVQESKDNTNRLLDQYKREGHLPSQDELAADGDLRLYGGFGEKPAQAGGDSRLESLLVDHFSGARDGDYIAVLAYVQESAVHDDLLQSVRTRLRDSMKVATTTGYGPRFLHSTGQLHKGGPASGIFLQITDDNSHDLAIPGEPYTFGVLKQAQALGDFQSLASRSRLALRLHLGKNVDSGLSRLLEIAREVRPAGDRERDD